MGIKGYEVYDTERVNHKHNAAKKWIWVVNNLGDFGRRDFLVYRDLDELQPILLRMLSGDAGTVETPAGP